MNKESVEQHLTHLKQEYVRQLPGKLKEMNACWDHLQHTNWDIKKLETLKQASHKLLGSGASYGFPDISTAAKLLEHELEGLKDHIEPKARTQITKHLAQLTTAIDAANKSLHTLATKQEPPLLTTPVKKPLATIAIIEDDQTQAEFLSLKLRERDYEVASFSSPEAFTEDTSQDHYDLIMLDVSFPEGPLAGLYWLEHIHKQLKTHCPIIITSARADFVARMRAVRAGASAYIAKPFDIDDVYKQIDSCLNIQKKDGKRILWVDDDAHILALYKEQLKQSGYLFEGITQPLKILEALESFHPDIIIMDYEMPGCNGAEVAAMLKQDVRFMTIPIIFVSGSNKSDGQNAQLNLLGNAFLKKPIDYASLLNTISTQLTKAKFLSGKIEKVSQRLEKNGLQTSRFFLENLETWLFQGNVSDESDAVYLAYATLDNVDYLRERIGLKHLSNLKLKLENTLSNHPLVQGNGCVFGQHSYLLLLRIAHSDNEKDALYALLHEINEQSWPIDTKSYKLSLSMGALELKQNNKLDEVISKVEAASFDAINAGGNRVVWVSSEEASQEALNQKLKTLMNDHAFKLYFQPIVNLETDASVFEALIRLSDEEGHTYSPNQFMPWVDEELKGGSVALDQWLIEQAIAEINTFYDQHNEPLTIVIKLASSLAEIITLLPEIRFSTQKTLHHKKGKLIFSIPVEIIIKNLEKTKQIIESLEELGCGFMVEHLEPQKTHIKLLNDLGKVDLAKIKIEGKTDDEINQFIRQIQSNQQAFPTLVVSGIEDSTMLAHFWELGVRHFQGYFIQRPGEVLLLNEN